MVGTVRFELTTSCTPSKRATKLRYVPNHCLTFAKAARFYKGNPVLQSRRFRQGGEVDFEQHCFPSAFRRYSNA
jgi:hypothetical protein